MFIRLALVCSSDGTQLFSDCHRVVREIGTEAPGNRGLSRFRTLRGRPRASTTTPCDARGGSPRPRRRPDDGLQRARVCPWTHPLTAGYSPETTVGPPSPYLQSVQQQEP